MSKNGERSPSDYPIGTCKVEVAMFLENLTILKQAASYIKQWNRHA